MDLLLKGLTLWLLSLLGGHVNQVSEDTWSLKSYSVDPQESDPEEIQ